MTRSIAQFDPVMQALGCTRQDADNGVSWYMGEAIALDAGWTAVSGPKLFPRFNERYYASFVEDDNGIRLEFMHNPPRASSTTD